MQYFELSDASAHKFWEVDQQECGVHVRFGKISAPAASTPQAPSVQVVAAPPEPPVLTLPSIIDLHPRLAGHALPSRRFPGCAPRSDAMDKLRT